VNITTGTGPGGQFASVELSDDDMRAAHPDWDEKTTLEKHRMLMNTGDLLIVDYLRASGQITPEFFRSRVTDIQSRYKPKEHTP
jgi:hypothetical protein